MSGPQPSDSLYFQAHGLAVRPPEELNASLAEAIGTYAVGVPGQPSREMSAAERTAFEALNVDVDDPGPVDRDPVQAGVIALARIIETALSVSEAAKRLGVTDSRVHQRITAREIYSFRIDARRHVPAFQFRGDALVPNIAEVNPALPENLHPVAVDRWYATPNPELVEANRPLSPLQWLQQGQDPQWVRKLAEALADHP